MLEFEMCCQGNKKVMFKIEQLNVSKSGHKILVYNNKKKLLEFEMCCQGNEKSHDR